MLRKGPLVAKSQHHETEPDLEPKLSFCEHSRRAVSGQVGGMSMCIVQTEAKEPNSKKTLPLFDTYTQQASLWLQVLVQAIFSILQSPLLTPSDKFCTPFPGFFQISLCLWVTPSSTLHPRGSQELWIQCKQILFPSITTINCASSSLSSPNKAVSVHLYNSQ